MGSNLYPLPAFAECPVRKDGDECEKGIRRSSRMPKDLPACTKRFSKGRFGEQVSEGGYASAGFAEAVKMPRAEARGASLFCSWKGNDCTLREGHTQYFYNLVFETP